MNSSHNFIVILFIATRNETTPRELIIHLEPSLLASGW